MAAARFGWCLNTIMPLLKAEHDVMTRHFFWHCHSFGITTFPLCCGIGEVHEFFFLHCNFLLILPQFLPLQHNYDSHLTLHYVYRISRFFWSCNISFWNISLLLQHAFGIPILFEIVRFFWHYNSVSYHPFTAFFWQYILVSDCFDFVINLASILFW